MARTCSEPGVIAQTPLVRLGQPQDIVAFLASVPQTIAHIRTRCRFKTLRLEHPLVEVLKVPFASYEMEAEFIGMNNDDQDIPSPEGTREWEIFRKDGITATDADSSGA